MTTFNSLVGNECPTEVAKLINAIISGKTNIDLDNLSQTGQAILDGKASISLNNLSSAGQAILDAKIEAEALAAQNGYIKFKLNGISILLCWGYAYTTSSKTNAQVNFPTSFNNVYSVIAGNSHRIQTTAIDYHIEHFPKVNNITLSNFCIMSGIQSEYFYIAIGN